MAYAFHRDDTAPDHSLRRIATEELSTALNRLAALPAPEAVHGIRKNLKKTRALLRLYRSALPGQPAANATLRGVAAALSAQRDAAVCLATLDRLFPELPDCLLALRNLLLADSVAPARPIPPGLAEPLAALRDEAATWRLRGKPHSALKDGLATTRRKARRAADAARAAPDRPDLVHEWRKRVKDLWYQTRLFAPVWPELFAPSPPRPTLWARRWATTTTSPSSPRISTPCPTIFRPTKRALSSGSGSTRPGRASSPGPSRPATACWPAIPGRWRKPGSPG
jgi:hypothetical protein